MSQIEKIHEAEMQIKRLEEEIDKKQRCLSAFEKIETLDKTATKLCEKIQNKVNEQLEFDEVDTKELNAMAELINAISNYRGQIISLKTSR